MKMTSADFTALKAMFPVDAQTEYQVCREWFGPKRTRWDMFWELPRTERQEWFDRGIYTYLDDRHIDTALKQIFKETK